MEFPTMPPLIQPMPIGHHSGWRSVRNATIITLPGKRIKAFVLKHVYPTAIRWWRSTRPAETAMLLHPTAGILERVGGVTVKAHVATPGTGDYLFILEPSLSIYNLKTKAWLLRNSAYYSLNAQPGLFTCSIDSTKFYPFVF